VVSISVGSGDDITEAQVREWCDREPRLLINMYNWVEPVGDNWWYNNWLQYARMHTPADMVFQMDADEIVDEKSYHEIRRIIQMPSRYTVMCDRLNFWRDHRNLIPHGHCLGHKVIRIGPADMYLASDGPDPNGNEAASLVVDSTIKIFHYGFVRKREAFFEKERFLQKAYFNYYDPRLEEAEKHDGNWMTMPGLCGWENDLIPYNGPHPEIIKPWLRERGMAV
jgi:hypothetical protein